MACAHTGLAPRALVQVHFKAYCFPKAWPRPGFLGRDQLAVSFLGRVQRAALVQLREFRDGRGPIFPADTLTAHNASVVCT